MMLLTQANKKALPELYAQDGKGDQATVHVKFFLGAHTWYIIEYDGTDIMFGLTHVVGGEDELGYISLAEMKGVKTRFGGVERDRWFKSCTIERCRRDPRP